MTASYIQLLSISRLISIQYRMYYKRGDVVLVKIENYPFWPAEIACILGGELYNVMFYGEKSQAVVDASAVKELTWERGKTLERQAILTKNKSLRVAIRLALKRLGERGRDHFEGEENVSQTIKSRQKGKYQTLDQPKYLENAKNHLLPLQDNGTNEANEEKMDIQISPSFQEQKMGIQSHHSIIFNRRSQQVANNHLCRQILRNQYEYDSLRSLLKKYSLGLVNINSYKLSLEEKEKIIILLTEKELLLQEVIEYWIIEEICSIITFVCFRGIPNEPINRDMISILVNYFNQIKFRIYSNEMEKYAITTQRKQGLTLRVRMADSYLQNPFTAWRFA